MLHTGYLKWWSIWSYVVLLHKVVPTKREQRCAWAKDRNAGYTVDRWDDVPRDFLRAHVPRSGFTINFDY
jgi:hypothetical protein